MGFYPFTDILGLLGLSFDSARTRPPRLKSPEPKSKVKCGVTGCVLERDHQFRGRPAHVDATGRRII